MTNATKSHKNQLDPIVTGKLNRGGAINTIVLHKLTSKNANGMATRDFLAEIERANIDEIKRKYPDAFKRHCHTTAGPSIDAFTVS